MKAVLFVPVALGMVIAFAIGFLIAKPRLAPSPPSEEISRAQEAADKLLPQHRVRMFRDKPWLKSLRQRGYEYCYRNDSIDVACAREQDEAVQSAFFAILISKAQQEMTDQNQLSLREREVARNPQLRTKIVRYCSRLYADHGKQDARLLAVCLGNLSEFSPLVEIPVP
jgi:hypothetical protein